MGSGQLEVRLLGRFAVSRNGEEVPLGAFGGRLSRRLLRYLVCSRGDLVPRDVLIDALWGDRPPTDPPANLKVLVSRARRVVGEAIRTGPGGYRIDTGACDVDAERFLAAVGGATRDLRTGETSAAARGFDAALALWTGEPLPEDLYEPWAAGPRRQLLDAYLEALEGGATTALAVGDAARATQLAALACDREPLREGAHVLLARGLVAAGDRPRALAVVRDLIDRTASELGLDPSPGVVRLQAELLADGAPPQGATAVPERRRDRRAHGHLLPFLVRDDDLPRAEAAFRDVPPSPVVVVGPPGSGKTRLLEELADRFGTAVVVSGHLAEQDRDGSLLRDVVRGAVTAHDRVLAGLHPRMREALGSLAPELGDATTTPVDAPSLRSLMIEGAVALLATVAEHGGALVVDDLQWADPTSCTILGTVVARLPGLRLAVGLRPRSTDGDEPVDRLLTHIHALGGGACRIETAPLTRAALETVAAGPLPRLLAEHTDRSPFAVTQVVAAWRAADLLEDRPGRLVPRPDAHERELVEAACAGYARSIRTWVERQPGAGRELLELMALLGRLAPARLLAVASGRDVGAVLEDLDALTRAGLARSSSRGWTVAHDLISGAVLEAADPAGRRRRHERLAAALRELDGDPGELAMHLEAGGDTLGAARAHVEAATRRLDRAASAEAARHAEAGLRLVSDGRLRRELLRLHAEALAATGELAAARARLREAVREAAAGAERAALLTRLAMLSLGAEDVDRAEELVELAVLEAGDDPTGRAHALTVAAVVDMNQDRPHRSRARADEALSLYESLRDPGGVAGLLDARAMAGFLEGDVTGALAAFHRVACAFEDAGQLLRVVTPRSTRGHALVFADRPTEGLADVEEAAQLAEALGHAEGLAYTAWHRSEALTALGRLDEAVGTAEAGIATATRIGHRGWTATGQLALGLAHATGGDGRAAARAYTAALESTGSLPLFHGWAAGRLARLHLGQGRIEQAVPLVRVATTRPPALARYEARVAEVMLLQAQGDPRAEVARDRALALARGGGHLASARVLADLASPDAAADASG